MNIKSQISTTREQSQRLLDLGLNPATADMILSPEDHPMCTPYSTEMPSAYKIRCIPSWSLSRLLEMMPQYIDEMEEVLLMIEPPLVIYYDTLYKGQRHFTTNPNLFDNCIAMIGWLIRNDFFNKEYLIEKDNKL